MRALRGLGWGIVVGGLGGIAAAQALAIALGIYWAIEGGVEALPMAIFLIGFFGGIVGAAVGAAVGAVLGTGLGGLGLEADAPLVTASFLAGAVVIATVLGLDPSDDSRLWIPVAFGAAGVLGAIGWWAGTLFSAWTNPARRPASGAELEFATSVR